MHFFPPKLDILVHFTSIQAIPIWNCDETRIQAGRQSGVKIIAKKKSHQVYNTIPKSKEWLTIKCVVNVIRGSIPWFYIFQGERIRGDYIMHCKPKTCMVIHIKTWMTSFLFKKILSFFKRLVLGGIFLSNYHLLALNGHGSHVSLEAIERHNNLAYIWLLYLHMPPMPCSF